MGWISNKLTESELRLFVPLVEILSQVSSDVRVEKAEIGCNKQIGHMHVGLGVWFPDGEKLYLHRCMNRWIYTNNSVGMDPSDFFLQFASTREAEQLLTKLIRDTLESKQSTGDPDGLKISEPASAANETELEEHREINKNVFNRLKDLYLRLGGDSSATDQIARQYSEVWAERVEQELGGEANEKIGSIFDLGYIPRSRHGIKTVETLKSRLQSLEAHGVTRDEIIAWWDRTAQDRQLFIVQHEMLLEIQTQESLREEGVDPSAPQSEWTQLAFLQAICKIPVFDYWKDEDFDKKTGVLAPLPWEIYDRVMEFLISRQDDDPNWLFKAIEAKSFNSYYRAQKNINI